MDPTTLATFIAVAEQASFSRAAERLFTTQPAVSKRIRALEQELGVSLFDRLNRDVRLTEAGETLLPGARRVLDELRNTRDAIRELGGRVGGRLKLGTSHHVGIHRLPPVLRTFVANYPEVELDLVFMDSEQACLEVGSGALELAIVTLPDNTEAADARLCLEPVWPDPLVIVAAPEHPLVAEAGSARSPLSRVDTSGARSHRPPGDPTDACAPRLLGEHRAVLPGRGTVTRRILLDALAPHDVDVITSLETNYLETIKMLVSVGLGWSVLPAHMLDDSVCEVRVSGLHMQRQLGTVTRRGRTPSRAAATLMNTVRQSVTEPAA